IGRHGVVVGAAVDDHSDRLAGLRVGGDRVVPGLTVHGQCVVRRFTTEDVHGGVASGDVCFTARTGHGEVVVRRGAVHDDIVRRAVADTRTCGGGEVSVHVGDVSAGEIVHGHRVGSAERIDVDDFDAGEVHRDCPDITGESHARTVRRQFEALGNGRAVE